MFFYCFFLLSFHSQDAPDIVMDVPVMQQSLRIERVPLTNLICAYQEKCLAKSARHYISYPFLFKRTLIRFTSRFWNRGTSDFNSNVPSYLWRYHGCHRHFHSLERFADYDLIGEISFSKKLRFQSF